MELQRWYRKIGLTLEHCFYIETSASLNPEKLAVLRWLLAETFEPQNFGSGSALISDDKSVLEFGPRLNFETAWSTNAVAICHACGLTEVTRLERSRRHILSVDANQQEFTAKHHDRMTECFYPEPLKTFETGMAVEPVVEVPLLQQGPDALRAINRQLGLGMDEWDIEFYSRMFIEQFQRNPTNVECFQLGQANSEHCRHWFFKGVMEIDGQRMLQSLLQIVQSTLTANPTNSVIAFKDNSSGIRGFDIWTIVPTNPGICSPFGKQRFTYHFIFTAETHNFPSGVAPFPGAETGTGGRIRDVQATGRGGLVVAGTAGFCVGNLNIPGYHLPGEDDGSWARSTNLATPLEILLKESGGAWDYGNKFGEPVIAGFTRNFGLVLPNGERREWLKPIMFTGGIGQLDAQNIEKQEPQKGMLIVQVGGPAHRIGVGGGAASSMIQGQNVEALDFNAVQRGNAQMENKMNRVIRACIEMGENNPILSIHDQGAGGPCNVLTELINPAGGRIEIRNIQVGDKTMSVLEIWGAEYQERNAFLIDSSRIEEFQTICQRERLSCEVLGEITGDGHIVVFDSQDNSTPVNLDLARILGKVPQKTFRFQRVPKNLKPLQLPEGLSVKEALEMVFALPSVGSKEGLLHRVDRSVTGLIARQQYCGPVQLPVADVAVIAQSHFSLTGAATSIGEQPIKMLVNEAAGARMAVGEMLTNLAAALITQRRDIKCSANWMWAAKLAGEGAALYDAAVAMADLMIKLGIAVDGGKDSLSMAAKVGDQTVKAPGQLVVSGYAPVPDITKVVTPDLKAPGKSKLMFIDLACGSARLGGSALAQAFGQIGDESPDVVNAKLLGRGFDEIQQLIKRGLILSLHDRSDGGLITCLLEMAFAGNCGLDLDFGSKVGRPPDPIAELFNEELGWAIEYLPQDCEEIRRVLQASGLTDCLCVIGDTVAGGDSNIAIEYDDQTILSEPMADLRAVWRKTSFQLDALQASPTVLVEKTSTAHRHGLSFKLTFNPSPTPNSLLEQSAKPKVAIIREEGTNGDREMASAFWLAGFEPWDVTMADLIEGKVSLKIFQGIVFPGGFSFADVLDAGKGWAAAFKFNPRVANELAAFVARKDTFVFGVCNGCQLMALLGVVPWPLSNQENQPRFIRNESEVFESRFVAVKILESKSIFLHEMAGSILGVWVAHGEGRFHCAAEAVCEGIFARNLVPLRFVNDQGKVTSIYPFNPNGSLSGITALSSEDGRFLAMMPHPERLFQLWQWPYLPADWQKLEASPWLKLFQNARQWCDGN